ncbi:MAG: MT-A70 family methyltransferase [Pseudomonadota bacterium]
MTPLPQGPFDLVLADPPWAFRTFNAQRRTPTQKKFREAEDHYPTMSIEEMAGLPVESILAKDAVLIMWLVGSHLDVAHDLARAWGFPRLTTDLFYWCKQKRLGADQLGLFTGDVEPLPMSMGYYTRKQIEPAWLFVRGKGLRVLDHGVRQMILAPKREHSRKPVEQYDRIDRLFGTELRRIELFARTAQPGWSAWGNQVGKFAPEGVAA